MSNQINLDDLQQLKARGIINEAEFQARKNLLVRKVMRDDKPNTAKSGIIYIFLAYFLGAVGLHNFYAGYWGRGLTLLLMSILSPLFLYIPLLIVVIVLIGEILFVNRAADRQYFSGSRSVIRFLRFLTLVSLLYCFQTAELVSL